MRHYVHALFFCAAIFGFFLPLSLAQASYSSQPSNCWAQEQIGTYPVTLKRTTDQRDRYVFQTAYSKDLLIKHKRMVAFFVWPPGGGGEELPTLKLWFTPDPTVRFRVDRHNTRVVQWPAKARLAKHANHTRKSDLLGVDMGKDVARVIELDAARLIAKYPDKAHIDLDIVTPGPQEKKRLWPGFKGRLNLQLVRQMLASEVQLNARMAKKSGKADAGCAKTNKIAASYSEPSEAYYEDWGRCSVKIEEDGIVAATGRSDGVTTRFMLRGTGKFTGIQISTDFDQKIFDSKYLQSNWRHRVWADAKVDDYKKNPLLVDLWSGDIRYEGLNVMRFRSHLKWPDLVALDATGEPISYRFALKDGTEYLTGQARSGIFTRSEKLARKAGIKFKSILIDRVKYCDLHYPVILI